MAEFVEIDLEKSITELEALVVLKLFETAEVKKFARQRRDNSYNLQKRTKDINDYKRYIIFEESLIKKIKKQRKKTGIKKRISEVDGKMLHRLQTFYRNALERYKSDLDFWMAYFKFCKRHKHFEFGTRMLQRLVQVHGDKPHLWLFACNWILDKKLRSQKVDYETARTWLVKGIERHSANEELYKALIKFDLDILREAEENEELEEEKKCEKIAIALLCVEVSYKNAKKAISNPAFHAEIINLISQYPRCEEFVKKTMNGLESDFSSSEEFWSSKALWALDNASPPIQFEDPQQLDRYRNEQCVEIFNEAVDKLPTKAMYEKYTEFLSKMIARQPDSLHPNFKSILYKTVLPAVVEKNLATPEHYLLLADFHLSRPGKESQAVETLRAGLKSFPEHVPMWYELIRSHLVLGQDENADGVFREAIAAVKKLPAAQIIKLWILLIGYLMEDSEKNKEQVEKLYQEGMRYKPEVAELLKPKFLQWRLVSGGIEAARDLLNEPPVANPPCLSFYQKMAEIEASQPCPDLKRIRHCHETILRVFGTKDADVWLDAIRFEKEDGDVKQVVKLYQRAINALSADQVDVFTTKYSLNF